MNNNSEKENDSCINYEMILMTVKNEYNESFKHREKLDAKINILFTVYAFIILIYIVD